MLLRVDTSFKNQNRVSGAGVIIHYDRRSKHLSADSRPTSTTQTFTKPHTTRGGVSSDHFLCWKSYDWSTLMKNKTITTTLVSSFTFSVESSDGDREQVVGLDQQNKPPQMH